MEFKKNLKKVLTFGTFDGIHPGHLFFLNEAKKLGQELIIVVAQDETIKQIKGKYPKRELDQRIKDLKKENSADEVLPGDKKLGDWEILRKTKPDIVACGYDQAGLVKALEEFKKKPDFEFDITVLKSHFPEKYKSSLFS